ncbi:MAG: hypothetical protein RIC35_12605 [Marinoscillum sp.]
MFDGADFPQPLDEDLFDIWLENGRSSKLSYNYMLIIWDDFEANYQPVYAEDRSELDKYEHYSRSTGRESLVAAYDLFSESRIHSDR